MGVKNLDKIRKHVNDPHEIEIKKWKDDDMIFFVAYIPQLDSITGYGTSVGEALQALKEKKKEWVTERVLNNKRIAKPKNTIPVFKYMGQYSEKEMEESYGILMSDTLKEDDVFEDHHFKD